MKMVKPDSALPQDCLVIIGNTLQYSPAFETAKNRRNIVALTKDADYLPRLNSALDMQAFKRSTDYNNWNEELKQSTSSK